MFLPVRWFDKLLLNLSCRIRLSQISRANPAENWHDRRGAVNIGMDEIENLRNDNLGWELMFK